MIIGLVGAQRTGKTTLAKEHEKRFNSVYVDASISHFINQIGFDSRNQSYSYEERIRIQEHLLFSLATRLATRKGSSWTYVTDRTFYDLIFYAVNNITDETDPKHNAWLNRYIRKCLIAQYDIFDGAMYVVPGIQVNNDKITSALTNDILQTRSDIMFRGIFEIDSFTKPTPINTNDLEARLLSLNTYIGNLK